MKEKEISFFSHTISPFVQAGVALGAAFAFMVIGKIFAFMGVSGFDYSFPWTAAGAVCLLFAMFNSLNSFTTEDMLIYYRNSIFSYMGLVAISSVMAYLFSGTSLNDADSFKWIFVVITMSYMGFIGVVSFIKFIFMVLGGEEEKLSQRKE